MYIMLGWGVGAGPKLFVRAGASLSELLEPPSNNFSLITMPQPVEKRSYGRIIYGTANHRTGHI